MAAVTFTRQRETTHEVTIPMPRVTPTASPLSPMQLSEQTLAWLAERPGALTHVRSVWDATWLDSQAPSCSVHSLVYTVEWGLQGFVARLPVAPSGAQRRTGRHAL